MKFVTVVGERPGAKICLQTAGIDTSQRILTKAGWVGVQERKCSAALERIGLMEETELGKQNCNYLPNHWEICVYQLHNIKFLNIFRNSTYPSPFLCVSLTL